VITNYTNRPLKEGRIASTLMEKSGLIDAYAAILARTDKDLQAPPFWLYECRL
jgi:hypothetical protein